MYKEICDNLKETSLYTIDINKLRSIDNDIDYELESRSGNPDYKKIYNKFQKSKTGKVKLDINDLDYISYIYENSPKHDEIITELYKKVN